jgi:peroxiredoxin
LASVVEQVRMLADPTAEVTKALGLELDLTAILGGIRSGLGTLIL